MLLVVGLHIPEAEVLRIPVARGFHSQEEQGCRILEVDGLLVDHLEDHIYHILPDQVAEGLRSHANDSRSLLEVVVQGDAIACVRYAGQ